MHYTYELISDPEHDDLCQGDILRPTAELRALFEQVHPHFVDAKYSGFLILTQTCDLVRRGGRFCKSRYINLAVYRPLAEVLLPLLDKCCESVTVGGVTAPGVYCQETRTTAEQLLARIINQNAQAEGIFYLHPDADARVGEPCATLLQVSVAVRAEEHYEKLVRARTGRLKEQFQSKLGWLLGNLYSRVATMDMPDADRKELIRRQLDNSLAGPACRPYWIAKAKVKLAQKSGLSIGGQSTQDIVRVIEQLEPSSPKRIAIELAVKTIREVIPNVPDEQLQRISNRLAANPVFSSACKS